ncbi:hypothetical protein A9F05_05035 [Lactiplantibacillus plantarum]|nr:hypothetical protein A9F05_05035 [Lactiplantibacillus plantarum]
MTINLIKYGLTTAVQADLTKENGQILGRIIGQHRDWYQVITTAGERSAQVTGKLAYEAASPAAFPAVGCCQLYASVKSTVIAVRSSAYQSSNSSAGGPKGSQSS